ncbi:S9 family peptidase [uncultured Arthrobacter sp.]|uniref:alpha/beta hydrolase family protein n=1 Tax=uncultured Arthrobacter sp. TaxID=114050 RepID=UPI00261C906D|nr:alpha/beta fold hydrolase [uncultured Arthrobacter sp.]
MPLSSPPAVADRQSWFRWAALGLGAGAAASSVIAGATSALAAHFAKEVVTPRKREENLEILAVVQTGEGMEVILPANEDTTVEGIYSLYFDEGRGHARIGSIRSFVPREGTVQRTVETVYSGDLRSAVRGWWSGAVYPIPSALGFADEPVDVPVAGGTAPAWLVRAESPSATWAIMVHGRGVQRSEGLRAVRTAREVGMTSLLVSYRNDGEAPFAADGRYGLGMTEWQDIEAAMEYAFRSGAHDVVLFGWSMGGAICLQAADSSRYRTKIRALVLDGPVIDWMDVLTHQAELNRIPAPAGRLGQWLISNSFGRLVTGLSTPVDLKSMDWVTRADQLTVPVLILHSEDDEFVPVGPSAELAERNPVFVTFERFYRARHTKEWNVDPERWHSVTADWLRLKVFDRVEPKRLLSGP